MDTRARILDSAERTVRERGLDAFSYADVANDLGIRKASIHYHFPAKSDLALALIQRYRTALFERLSEIAALHDKAGDRLAAYIEVYRDALSGGDSLCLCVAFSISRDSLEDASLEELNRFHRDSIAWLAELFSRARKDRSVSRVGDPQSEAAACLATAEGAQLIAHAARDLAPFDRAVAQLQARIA